MDNETEMSLASSFLPPFFLDAEDDARMGDSRESHEVELHMMPQEHV